jgi:hypothetical protein
LEPIARLDIGSKEEGKASGGNFARTIGNRPEKSPRKSGLFSVRHELDQTIILQKDFEHERRYGHLFAAG